MRVAVAGLGVQGRKRIAAAGTDVVATVDPRGGDAQYRQLEQVPLSAYDAALVCTPDDAKIPLLDYLLSRGKHVLVEKPLLAQNSRDLERLAAAAAKSGTAFYTAYNHRFEPHFVRMKELLGAGTIGTPYTASLFYGNGTARVVRDSAWRDRGSGVLSDLGSHLLDTVLYWFGRPSAPFRVLSASRCENRAWDHVVFGTAGSPALLLEVTLLSWRNDFRAEVLAEKGSAHIGSLCKWGPSTFTVRKRKLPSGRPDEEPVTLECADPTWAAEYAYFKGLCSRGESNIANDIWINEVLAQLARDAGSGTENP